MPKNSKVISVNANPILDIENNDDVKEDVQDDVKEEASNDIDTVAQDMPITEETEERAKREEA